jgi:hypothetical protein
VVLSEEGISMGVYVVAVANALAVGTDISNNQKWALDAKRSRKIVRIGLIGSTAAGDTKLEVSYGADTVMTIYNTVVITTGFKKPNLYWHTSHLVCQPGVQIHVNVIDPPNAAAQLFLDIR